MTTIKLTTELKQKFELIELNNQLFLFSYDRIERENIPNGLYVYGVRHSDTDGMTPSQFGFYVWVNHMFDIISINELDLETNYSNSFITDFDYSPSSVSENYLSIKEFIQFRNR